MQWCNEIFFAVHKIDTVGEGEKKREDPFSILPLITKRRYFGRFYTSHVDLTIANAIGCDKTYV